LSEQLSRVQELRDRLASTEQQLEELQSPDSLPGRQDGKQAGKPGGRGGRSSPTMAGTGDPHGSGEERQQRLERLRQEYARMMRQAQELNEQLRREGGGIGFTPEGQQMVMSAPGTEAFKQDFAQWNVLKKNVGLALEQLEASLSRQLQAQAGRDRLNSAGEQPVPDAYGKLVDQYYRSIAVRPNK
jgi:hypothetical protein